MRAVQQTQFGPFKAADVVRDRHAHGSPIRLHAAQVVFDDPLGEAFTLYGPTIDDTKLLRHELTQRVIGRGRDAVDHARWEGDAVVDPGGKLGIDDAAKVADAAPQSCAVVGEIVAADDRRRCNAARAPLIQCCAQKANQGARFAWMRQIERDVGMLRVQRALRAQAIAFLGHRRGDEVRLRITQTADYRLRRFACDEQFLDRTDDLQIRHLITHGEGVQAVLRPQGVTHLRGLQRHFANAPTRIAFQRAIDIPRLVYAMKSARTEMNDAGVHGIAIVRRYRNAARGKSGQGRHR